MLFVLVAVIGDLLLIVLMAAGFLGFRQQIHGTRSLTYRPDDLDLADFEVRSLEVGRRSRRSWWSHSNIMIVHRGIRTAS